MKRKILVTALLAGGFLTPALASQTGDAVTTISPELGTVVNTATGSEGGDIGVFYNPLTGAAPVNPFAELDTVLAGVVLTAADNLPGIPPGEFPPDFPPADLPIDPENPPQDPGVADLLAGIADDPASAPDQLQDFVTTLLGGGVVEPEPDPTDADASAPLTISGLIEAKDDACSVALPASVDFAFGTTTQADLANDGPNIASDPVTVTFDCGPDRSTDVTFVLSVVDNEASPIATVAADFTTNYDPNGPSDDDLTEETTLDVSIQFDGGTSVAAGESFGPTAASFNILATATLNPYHQLGGTIDSEGETLYAYIQY